jgi:integration host factor subunit beta
LPPHRLSETQSSSASGKKISVNHKEQKPHMTKAELIEEVARVVEMTRKDSETIVETIFDSIVNSLHKGEKIEIRGFGSFRTRQRQPRVGRNPKTGSRVEVPSKRIPYFKPSKELRDLVNDAAEKQAAAQAQSQPAAPASAATVPDTNSQH